ncbi:MAG: hypothetical protein A2Y77_07280 [Planctomycetes bacterium RBG_13_62_9]|nr:MAG: hypothetical protein A2Y77_07280 [Planctomycetes bacterium RBG_13_62_9]
MELLQIRDLRELVEHRTQPCVSMYLPTHRTGRDTLEDPIRLKNAVSEARERLDEAGYSKERISTLLNPAVDLIPSQEFWLHQSDGLALFLSPDLFRHYRLPLQVQDEVVVTDHFSVKQLVPLFAEDGRFYVLTLSQKRVRLFEATRLGIRETPVPDMLKNIDEFKQYDVVEESLQAHTMAMTQTARTNLVFHGQGNIADKATYKDDVVRYLRAISRTLERYLGAGTAPLLLAGVEYELSFYRQVNSYHHLLDEGIAGNPDERNEKEIHEAAWHVVEPHFAQARHVSLGHYADLSRTDKASDSIAIILPAAHHGRVRTLFIRRNAWLWGRFDTDTLSVEAHDAPEPGDVDMIDLVTVQVLQHQGMIYALDDEEMPTENPLAAMFRY